MKNGRFEVFTAVTMKNGVFWVVTACGSCKNRRFGGIWHLLHQGDKNRTLRSSSQRIRLLVAACVVPSLPSFDTLMKEAPGSSETSVLTRVTRRNNPEDTILQGYTSMHSLPWQLLSYWLKTPLEKPLRQLNIKLCPRRLGGGPECGAEPF
jgi:hypothetical protein